ncbi:MAG: efflux RND transporter periplasmic adaptor subunit [FCB group bacterium]|jgi:multidrug efflux pump subunit AcrA (membrane-fusion protein)
MTIPMINRFKKFSGNKNMLINFHAFYRFMFKVPFSVFIIITFFLLINSCTEKSNKIVSEEIKKAQVLENGLRIKFPENSPGLQQITVEQVKLGSALVSSKAPSRIVAAISTAVSSKDRIVIFESTDITMLYSQYKQAKINTGLFTKNLERIKEMYEHQGATAKDLNQAENDLNLSKTTLTELEGRLRTSGFNPVELDGAGNTAVWLISDVPESQLQEVQFGEDVDIVFNAFPQTTLVGKVVSIGDIIDPTTRTVKVRIIMNNYKGELIPGMFASVEFGDPIDSVFVLPTSSVITVEGKDYIFIEEQPGEFTRREVNIKRSSSNTIIITHGLKNGEKVVSQGAILLKGLSFGY